MKKYLIVLTAFVSNFFLVGCTTEPNPTDDPNPDPLVDELLTEEMYDGEIIVSYPLTLENDKTILMVDDVPFLFIGSQIRTDALMNTDKYDYEAIGMLFEKAKELGVTSVQIPVEWKDIELEEDVWDFSYLDQMLRFAYEYDLKMELLWFGTNMVGDTHSYTVPDYIIKDGRTYPKLDAKRTGEFWNYYGIMWYLDFNNPNLMEKESNAALKMMEFVYEWDRTHGAKHSVIGVQILNEADAFVRWRLDGYDVQDPNGGLMTYETAWEKVMESLNTIGLAVKSAPYKVYTRTNFANSTGSDNISSGHGIYSGTEVKNPPLWVTSIYDLEGIDIVGDDSYKSNLIDIKGIIHMYGENLEGNFPHIAENDGSYSNTSSLILSVVSQGGGYSIYDLFTSPFYVLHGQSGVDQGIIELNENGDIINKEHFEGTMKIISGLKLGFYDVVTSSPEDFAAFNIKSNHPQDLITQVINTKSVTIEFSTSTGALAYAVTMKEYITVLATDVSTMQFSNVELGYCNMDL